MNITNMDLTQLIGKPLGTEYDLFMTNDVIDEGCEYNNFITFCRNLSPYDIVNLHISCSGGRASTASIICQAIEDSQANFIAHLNSYCWSASTVVALACDAWVVGDLVEFGIHTVQGGTGFTELPKIQYRAKALVEFNDRLFDKYYAKGFLTDEEIVRVKDGLELTFFKEELENRLQQYATLRVQQSTQVQETLSSPPDLSKYTEEELQEELTAIDEDLKTFQQDKKTIREELKKRSKSVVVDKSKKSSKKKGDK
ncbi:MAG: hypothetical protein KBT03_13110 [Bacteroidales bacterium]|nr:hypothetical protein [Candidatus Scybalousia scybalohippi]